MVKITSALIAAASVAAVSAQSYVLPTHGFYSTAADR